MGDCGLLVSGEEYGRESQAGIGLMEEEPGGAPQQDDRLGCPCRER